MKSSQEVHTSLHRPKMLGIIPARFASTRFPGKPLIDIHGKSMIQRVYERAKTASSLADLVVATDDERILEHVKEFGGKVIMTANTHQSGTDRCAEVAAKMSDFDVVINIQGDEPFIINSQIDLLAGCFTDESIELATLVKEIVNVDELNNPNSPKVILNTRSEAIYFSRTAIPYVRGAAIEDLLDRHTFFKHIGIYGYRTDVLKEITSLPVSSLEKAESLEQLRWLENGYRIKVAVTDLETKAIDTPEDLQTILKSES